MAQVMVLSLVMAAAQLEEHSSQAILQLAQLVSPVGPQAQAQWPAFRALLL